MARRKLLGVGLLAAVVGPSPHAAAQIAVQELVGGRPHVAQYFGTAIDVDGDTAVIATHEPGRAGPGAFIYERAAGLWHLGHALDEAGVEPSPFAYRAVAIDGDWIAVSGQGFTIYRRRDKTWIPVETFPEGSVRGLALRRETLVAGLDLKNVVRVYERLGGAWTQTKGIMGPVQKQHFGASVALHGDWLLVGAPSGPENAFLEVDKGGAYFYRRERGEGNTVQWVLKTQAKGTLASEFGSAVALRGDTALVGAPGRWNAGGIELNLVYVFERQADDTWEMVQRIQIPEVQFPNQKHFEFGRSLALDDDDLLIGAREFKPGDLRLRGAGYHYRRLGGEWELVGRLHTPDQGPFDALGFSVSLAGAQALVGAIYENRAFGVVHAFDLAAGAQQFASCNQVSPCANAFFHGGCENSTGFGAVLAAAGTSSFGADDLRLEAHWLPTYTPVLWRMGSEIPPTPFGDGLLCIRDAYAFGVLTSDGEGAVQLGPGLALLSQLLLPPAGWIAPGDVWSFQCSYRDPAGPCGSEFNHTNGVRVTFGP